MYLLSDQVLQALVKSRNHPDEHVQRILMYTKGVIFMGTPHSGADALAKWAERLATSLGLIKQMNAGILDVLRRDSEVLYRVQTEFHTMIRDRGKKNEVAIEIACFFEELPLGIFGIVGFGHSCHMVVLTWIGCASRVCLSSRLYYNWTSLQPYPDDEIPRC